MYHFLLQNGIGIVRLNFLFYSSLFAYDIFKWNKIIYYLQVEALAVQLTQREGELILEKAEVKKLANFLK